MRFPAFAVFFLTGLLFLNACSSTEVVEVRERARSVEPSGQPLTPQDDPLRIVIGETEKIRSLDPLFIHNNSSKRIAQFIYEGLTRLGEDGRAIPAIASNWTVSSDSLTYTFTLREDAFFHDDQAFTSGLGRSVTSDDVKRAFTRMTAFEVPEHAGLLFADHIEGFEAFMVQQRNSYYEQDLVYEEISGIETPDERTVIFTLNQPYEGFAELLASPFASVYPQEVFDNSPAGLHSSPVGTGPFVFVSASADTLITLERNFNHYDSDLVQERITSLEFRYFETEAALFTALNSNRVDVIPQIGPQTAKIIISRTDMGLEPGYDQNFTLVPTGREHLTLSFVEQNFARATAENVRPLIDLLDSDAFRSELPASVDLRLHSFSEQNDEDTSQAPGTFTARIGAPAAGFSTYLAGLHANIMDEDFEPAIFLTNYANRDLILFWSGDFSAPIPFNSRTISDVEITHHALFRKSIEGLEFNNHSWWMSLADTRLTREEPS